MIDTNLDRSGGARYLEASRVNSSGLTPTEYRERVTVAAADPLALEWMRDVDGVQLPPPTRSDHPDDARRLWVWSGSPFHWIPGVDGNPGDRPDRVVDMSQIGLRLCVDSRRSNPTLLDRRDRRRRIQFTTTRSTPTVAGFDVARDATQQAGRPQVWRDEVRTACATAEIVAVDPGALRSASEAAFISVCAAMNGVPVVVTDWDVRLTRILHPQFVGAIESIDRARLLDDAYYRDLCGVDLRRLALKHHSEVTAWRTLAPGSAPEPLVLVMVSTIRPEFLPQVVAYLNAQTHRRFEVHVVVDRVEVSDEQVEDCRASADFAVKIERNADPVSVGEIYNRMMRESTADIAVIWDDDDHYAPDHLLDLVQALEHSSAVIAGKWAEFFHLAGPDLLIQRSPDGRYSDSPSLGGSNLAMWRAQILASGGFRPVMSGYDQELVRRVRESGGTTFRTHGYGYVAARRVAGHTWNPGDDHFIEQSVRQWPGLDLDNAGFGSPADATSRRRHR